MHAEILVRIPEERRPHRKVAVDGRITLIQFFEK
jgi:hypothetical protein